MSAKVIEQELRDLINDADDDTLLLLAKLTVEEIDNREKNSESFQNLTAQLAK